MMMMGLGRRGPTRFNSLYPLFNPLYCYWGFFIVSLLYMLCFLLFYIYNIIKKRVQRVERVKMTFSIKNKKKG